MSLSDQPGGPGPPALSGRDIWKRFGGVQAVAGVSIEIWRREVVGLVGENGAGKSTLVKVLSGIESPDSGEILVDGHTVAFRGPADAQEAGIRIAAQELQLAPDLSVTENLLMGQLPTRGARVDWPTAHERARQRLELLGVEHVDTHRLARSLSVVERAFVQIARALDTDATVLILDEPTAPMDDRDVQQLLGVLDRITGSGTAVLYISHRLNEVFEICDRVVVMKDGSRVASFDRSDLTTDGLVRSMIGASLEAFERSEAPDWTGDALAAHGLRSQDVDVDVIRVGSGEVVSVYGTMGSGREEIGGILMGRVGSLERLTVGGRAVPRRSTPAVIEAGVGYVPAERRTQGLVLERSVRENLTLGMLRALSKWGRIDRRRERSVADGWIRRLAVATTTSETPVVELSGGSQQKVILARWLARGSNVLILEEPTRGVDVGTKSAIYRLLHELVSEGAAVLIVSSDLEEVVRVSHRVLVMRHGLIVSELDDFDESSVAAAAMVG